MTIEEIFSAAAKKGLSAKRWGGSRLLYYNGFTHEQRVRKWQAIDLAVRMGLEIPAEQLSCSVCGASPSSSIAYHSEDYGTMNGHYPVCRSCHMKIHNRFKNPKRWTDFVAAMGNGKKWFEELKDSDDSVGGTVFTTITNSPNKAKAEEGTMTSTPGKPINGKAMTNLFSFASKELTNSGVWAWILSGLKYTNTSPILEELAKKLFSSLQIPIPEEIRVLEREYSISGRQRIDVYIEGVSKGKSFIFFIENKISRDQNVCNQVKEYISSVQQKGVAVYPAIFSHDPLIKSQVADFMKSGSLNCEVKVFDIKDMLNLFSGTSFQEHDFLAQFYDFLKLKEQNLSVFAKSLKGRSGGRGGSLEQWLEVAAEREITELITCYVAEAEKLYPSDIAYNIHRSIAIHFATRSSSGKGSPVISLHPKKSNRNKGLYIGFSNQNLKKVFGREMPKNALPANFEDVPVIQGSNNWRFGYFATEEDIRQLLKGISSIIK